MDQEISTEHNSSSLRDVINPKRQECTFVVLNECDEIIVPFSEDQLYFRG